MCFSDSDQVSRPVQLLGVIVQVFPSGLGAVAILVRVEDVEGTLGCPKKWQLIQSLQQLMLTK